MRCGARRGVAHCSAAQRQRASTPPPPAPAPRRRGIAASDGLQETLCAPAAALPPVSRPRQKQALRWGAPTKVNRGSIGCLQASDKYTAPAGGGAGDPRRARRPDAPPTLATPSLPAGLAGCNPAAACAPVGGHARPVEEGAGRGKPGRPTAGWGPSPTPTPHPPTAPAAPAAPPAAQRQRRVKTRPPRPCALDPRHGSIVSVRSSHPPPLPKAPPSSRARPRTARPRALARPPLLPRPNCKGRIACVPYGRPRTGGAPALGDWVDCRSARAHRMHQPVYFEVSPGWRGAQGSRGPRGRGGGHARGAAAAGGGRRRA
jgi:hypothetical protein